MRLLPRTFLPRTLGGQTLAILLLGLVVSHVVALGVFFEERVSILSSERGRRTADRIAAVARFVEAAPLNNRSWVVRSLNGPGLEVHLSADSALPGGLSADWRAHLIRRVLGRHFSKSSLKHIRIRYDKHSNAENPVALESESFPGWMFGGMSGHMARMMGGGLPGGGMLRVSMRLSDGAWLNFRAPFVPLQSFWASGYFLWFLALTLGVLAVSMWAVKRASTPLALFARASERLGRDVNAPPISEVGPEEVRLAATAFNEMQRRLRRFVDDRTQMLAAISHDLRTPITRLKLRAELIEDEMQKNKLLSDLDEMEAMISSTLSFARDDAASEDATAFDLAVMLQDLCEDMADTGAGIRYAGLDHAPYTGKPVALKRALSNLADNAVSYGATADVSLSKTAEGLEVTINDQGPGIPEDQMEKVFTPFYRLERSRSRETGGVGLGLAVVRSIVHAHGGEVTLRNRAEGGLSVTVTLPEVGEAVI